MSGFIAFQSMQELSVYRAEHTFDETPISRFATGSLFRDDFMGRGQSLEINASKFLAAIHYQGVRKSAVSFHATADQHHKRPIARRVECQVKCKNSATEAVQ